MSRDLADAVKPALKIYFDEIRSLVKEAKAGIKKGEITELQDWVSETLDGHEWIIYTYKARIVLICTDNATAYEDEMGEKAPGVEQEAYMAMRADLNAALAAEGLE